MKIILHVYQNIKNISGTNNFIVSLADIDSIVLIRPDVNEFTNAFLSISKQVKEKMKLVEILSYSELQPVFRINMEYSHKTGEITNNQYDTPLIGLLNSNMDYLINSAKNMHHVISQDWLKIYNKQKEKENNE